MKTPPGLQAVPCGRLFILNHMCPVGAVYMAEFASYCIAQGSSIPARIDLQRGYVRLGRLWSPPRGTSGPLTFLFKSKSFTCRTGGKGLL